MRKRHILKLIFTIALALMIMLPCGLTSLAADVLRPMAVEYNTDEPLSGEEPYEEEAEDDSANVEAELENGTAEGYRDEETGYTAYILDYADLLSPSEEEDVLESMKELCYYGNVAFCSVSENEMQPSAMASQMYVNVFGSNKMSGSLFLVDMEHRELYLHNAGNVRGDISYVITSSKSSSIMDNVYKLASAGDYAACAKKVFRQELTLLGGGKIAQPMRLVSNIFLSIAFALLVSYGVVMAFSKTAQPTEKELLAAIRTKQRLNDYQRVFTHQTTEYSPRSSSSGGGGGGGGGGGHTSGGGHGF